jgi:hypothetical protein
MLLHDDFRALFPRDRSRAALKSGATSDHSLWQHAVVWQPERRIFYSNTLTLTPACPKPRSLPWNHPRPAHAVGCDAECRCVDQLQIRRVRCAHASACGTRHCPVAGRRGRAQHGACTSSNSNCGNSERNSTFLLAVRGAVTLILARFFVLSVCST